MILFASNNTGLKDKNGVFVERPQWFEFAEQNRYIFTKWTKFDLNKELQAKISQEVYS